MELRNHVTEHMSRQESARDDENASDDKAASTPITITITNSAPLPKLTLIDKNSNKAPSRNLKFKPQMRYAIAQLFAGSILINTRNGNALMANTVELYGRTKTVDVHREVFGKKNDCDLPTSLPSPFNPPPYTNVWPTTVHHKDGEKLVIGTQTCNILITSSLRLDFKDTPHVGPSTPRFLLDKQASLGTLIFLDSDCVQAAISLAKNLDRTLVSPRNLIFQARQLQSKYHLPSTYFLCRSSGPITQAHNCQPYTVFTIADFDQGRTPQGKIFSVIAESVLKNGDEAPLDKSLVHKVYLNSTGNTQTVLGNILDPFVPPSSTRLAIMGNEALNKLLEELARILSSPISTVNRTSQAAITHAFSCFDLN